MCIILTVNDAKSEYDCSYASKASTRSFSETNNSSSLERGTQRRSQNLLRITVDLDTKML